MVKIIKKEAAVVPAGNGRHCVSPKGKMSIAESDRKVVDLITGPPAMAHTANKRGI